MLKNFSVPSESLQLSNLNSCAKNGEMSSSDDDISKTNDESYSEIADGDSASDQPKTSTIKRKLRVRLKRQIWIGQQPTPVSEANNEDHETTDKLAAEDSDREIASLDEYSASGEPKTQMVVEGSVMGKISQK